MILQAHNKDDAEMLIRQGILALVAYRDGRIDGDAFDSILGSVAWMDCLAVINDCPFKGEKELNAFVEAVEKERGCNCHRCRNEPGDGEYDYCYEIARNIDEDGNYEDCYGVLHNGQTHEVMSKCE